MVKIIDKEDQKQFICEECGLAYADNEIAKKCEAWCKEHKSCNLDIIKYAIHENGNTSAK